MDADSISEERCHHQIYCESYCEFCKKRVNDASAIPLGYIQKGLKIGVQGMDQLRQAKLRTLFYQRKLCLVLDLDLTLLHSVERTSLSEKEKYLMQHVDLLKYNPNASLRLSTKTRLTKLRPFARSFLEEASKMFEMYVYTMGNRSYASKIVDFLDPRKEYFGYRVISTEDCTQVGQKGLDVVIAPESLVVILDDSPTVWENHKENLIVTEKYKYFRDCFFPPGEMSLAELMKDESETDGALARVLKDLRRIYQLYYDSDLPRKGKDTRLILKEVVPGAACQLRASPAQASIG